MTRFRFKPLWLSLAVLLLGPGAGWAGVQTPPAPALAALLQPTVQVDRQSIDNGGEITVSGRAAPGVPIYLEVWAADKSVRANRFDNKKDPQTGQIPYIFYLTHEMPAYYKIFVPADLQPAVNDLQQQGDKWSFAKALEKLGAQAAYTVPADLPIERYKASIMASIIGSRGDLMAPMAGDENRKRSMQLVKARFKKVENVLGAAVEMQPDGSYQAHLNIRSGLAPGQYQVVAVAGGLRSEPAVFENRISFPVVYLGTAGTSQNLFWPFLLTLGVAIFGVLMGAGGGFILNPLLVSFFPLPHTVVAGTVMPTVLFSQGSGIYNYSKIKFISWKLGCAIGAAMLLGGFIGPKLTELITLSQFKFAFGWILLVLALLMFWQTTPGYLARNKKEQAILKEFKKRAEETAKGKQVQPQTKTA